MDKGIINRGPNDGVRDVGDEDLHLVDSLDTQRTLVVHEDIGHSCSVGTCKDSVKLAWVGCHVESQAIIPFANCRESTILANESLKDEG